MIVNRKEASHLFKRLVDFFNSLPGSSVAEIGIFIAGLVVLQVT